MTGNMAGAPRRIARRLAGPAGPELGCEECFDALDICVELELAGAAGAVMPAMREHLLGCSACRDDHDSLLALLRADPQDPA